MRYELVDLIGVIILWILLMAVYGYHKDDVD